MLAKREPEDVFTPNTVAAKDMFERRNEPDRFGNPGLQDRVVESLRQRGAQLRVFGDTGVGKTSLVTFAAAEAGREILTVECRTSFDYADILEQALGRIHGVRLSSYVKRREVSAEIEGQGGWKFLASIRGKITGATGQDRTFEIVDKSPLDLLIDLMAEKGYSLLVLDNFQNVIDRDTRTEVAQTMEVLADRADSTRDIKMIVIGIAEDANTLLTPSQSVRRRTVDIGVPRMPDEEIRAILTTGFNLLHLPIDPSLEDHLVYYCDGFPFFTHLIGLNISRAARRGQASRITRAHISAGLLRTVNEVDETYAARVRMANERGGKVQPKRHLLQLLAQSTERTWTCGRAKQIWQVEYPSNSEKLQFIDVAMGSLIKKENGSVLTRDESTTPYRYRFSDPHFRAYLRLRAELGDVGGSREELLASPRRAEWPQIFPGSLS